jgi:hypothetical protein
VHIRRRVLPRVDRRAPFDLRCDYDQLHGTAGKLQRECSSVALSDWFDDIANFYVVKLHLLHGRAPWLRFCAWNIRGQLQYGEQYHAVHGSQRILSWNCWGDQPRQPDDVPVVRLHASSWHLYHQRTACYLPERHYARGRIVMDFSAELHGYSSRLRFFCKRIIQQLGRCDAMCWHWHVLPRLAGRILLESVEQPNCVCPAIHCFCWRLQCQCSRAELSLGNIKYSLGKQRVELHGHSALVQSAKWDFQQRV